jgi:hypothetical protein
LQVFIAQTLGSIIGCFVNYAVLDQVIDAKRPYLDGSLIDPTGQVRYTFNILEIELTGLASIVGRSKAFYIHERFSHLGAYRSQSILLWQIQGKSSNIDPEFVADTIQPVTLPWVSLWGGCSTCMFVPA